MLRKNQIIKFLEGEWFCRNITIVPDNEIMTSEYKEKMVCTKKDVLTITAYGIKDGKDLTKDMYISMDGQLVTLSQDDFIEKGTIDGNVVTLVCDDYHGNKYVNKMYLMEDKYIYQMDVLKENNVVRSQISY